MSTITANELRIKGISVVAEKLKIKDEAVITVRDKNKYVIMDLDKYAKLYECEQEVALIEAKTDMTNSKYVIESVVNHIKRIN